MSNELSAQEIKKAILANKKLPEPVEQAELLEIKFWLFRCSSYEFESWREYVNSEDPQKVRLADAKFVQISARDKTGKPVFAELDVPILGSLPVAEIDPITKAGMRINGFGEKGEQKIVKNLIKIHGVGGVYDLLASMDAPCPNCTKDTPPTNSPNST